MSNGAMPDETNIAGLLNLFMYLDYEVETGSSVPKDIAGILDTISERMKENKVSPDNSKWKCLEILQRAFSEDGEYASMRDMQIRIPDPDKYPGISGAVFCDDDNVYVVFRGTGDGKWIDNGQTLVEDRSESQQQAMLFFDEMAEEYGWDENTNITVTGHSKGGNNAQSVIMGAEYGEFVDQCISFDGQGVSEAAYEQYQKELGESFAERTDKIYSINGKNDYVNVLGIRLASEDNTYYIETNCDDSGIIEAHALEYLFYQGTDENGNAVFSVHINGETEGGRGVLSMYAERINQLLFLMPEEIRGDCAMVFMQLMEMMDGSWIGYNGDYATAEEWIGFFAHGIPLLLNSIITTEEGRDALLAILRQLIETSVEENGLWYTIGMVLVTIGALPIVLTIIGEIVVVAEILDIVLKTVEFVKKILKELEKLTEQIEALFKECWEIICEYGERIGNWVRENVFGKTVYMEADFMISSSGLTISSENIRVLKMTYLNKAERLAIIRNNLAVTGLTGSRIKAKIAWLEYKVRNVADKAGRMAQILELCVERYNEAEHKITENALMAN